jgi:hypothetical protein
MFGGHNAIVTRAFGGVPPSSPRPAPGDSGVFYSSPVASTNKDKRQPAGLFYSSPPPSPRHRDKDENHKMRQIGDDADEAPQQAHEISDGVDEDSIVTRVKELYSERVISTDRQPKHGVPWPEWYAQTAWGAPWDKFIRTALDLEEGARMGDTKDGLTKEGRPAVLVPWMAGGRRCVLPTGSYDYQGLPNEVSTWFAAISRNAPDESTPDYATLDIGGKPGWVLFVVALIMWRIAKEDKKIKDSLQTWERVVEKATVLFKSIIQSRNPSATTKHSRISKSRTATTTSQTTTPPAGSSTSKKRKSASNGALPRKKRVLSSTDKPLPLLSSTQPPPRPRPRARPPRRAISQAP